MYAVLFNNNDGEVMPQCSVCSTCIAYYKTNDPETNEDSKQIQDDLRCDMAIAMAGEIAQRAICGEINEHDFDLDRSRAKELSGRIHWWIHEDRSPYWDVCKTCGPYRDLMVQWLESLVAQTRIRSSIKKLAKELEKLENHKRMNEAGIDSLLGKTLKKNSKRHLLPAAQVILSYSDTKFPSPLN